MVKIPAVLISPLEPVLAQDSGEAIKKHGIVATNGVVSDREFQRHRDERERDDENSP